MRALALAVLFGSLISGCKREAGPETSQPSPTGAKADAGLHRRMLGRWSVRLNDTQRRQLTVMRLAFRDPPPNDEELGQAGLSDVESAMVKGLLDLRKQRPDDPQLAEARKVVDGMDQSSLRIGTSSLSMHVGGLEEQATYQIVSDTSTAVVIRAQARSREEILTLKMPSTDTLELGKPDQREVLTFERVP